MRSALCWMAIEKKFVADLSWGVPVPVTALKSLKPSPTSTASEGKEDQPFIPFSSSLGTQTAVDRFYSGIERARPDGNAVRR